MTDPAPGRLPARKRPSFAPALFIAFLPLAPLLFMQWGASGASAERRIHVLILAGTSIPIGVST
jgi:hypothetical protein